MKKSASSMNKKSTFIRIAGLAALILCAAVFINALPNIKAQAESTSSFFGLADLFSWQTKPIVTQPFDDNIVASPQDIKTVCAGSPDFTTIAAAVTDANALGAGLVRTYNVCAGHTETLTGRLTLTKSGIDAANQIIFQKDPSTFGANPKLTAYIGTTTPGSAIPDGMFALSGADFVTIDGIDLLDPNTTNPATMEYGYGLFKTSATDGAQNDTIKNSVITLSRNNNASGTAPFQDGSIGIYVGNSLVTTATTVITPTALSGTNSFNKFYTNTIQNVNIGIGLSGFAGASGTTGDTGNDVGGASAATGNQILNFGGGGTTNAAAGIRANNEFGTSANPLNISYNTINNNNGSGVNHATTLRGIYGQAGASAFANINNNTVTLSCAATTNTSTAIENVIGSTAAANTVNINNNTVQNSTYATATTGSFNGILNTAAATTVNINGNNVSNNTLGVNATGTTGGLIGVSGGSPTNLNVNNNTISGNTKNGSSGAHYGIQVGTAILTVSGNTITNLAVNSTITSTSSITLRGIYDVASATSETYSNNTINNLTTSNASSSTSSVVSGIETNTISSSTITISGNTVNGLSFTSSNAGAAVLSGLRTVSGGTIAVSKNKVYDLTSNGASSTAFGLNHSIGNPLTLSNNLIGDIKTPSANAAIPLAGINISGGTTVNVYYNTVYLNASSTGALFGSAAIYASTSPTLTLRNNILDNVSTPTGATGFTAAYRRTSTTLTSYASASNNNDFYAGTPGANRLVFYDGTNSDQTLTAYKGRVTPRDAASITENPNFVSTSGSSAQFLHINTGIATALESNGNGSGITPAITDDYDGDTRNASPDIGADEFAGISAGDTNPPAISYTALADTGSTANRTVSVTITDATGVDQTTNGKPRIYYRKGTTGSYQVAACTLTGGSATNGTYDCTIDNSAVGGVTGADTIQYYVAAQDTVATPNVATSPAGGSGATPPGSTAPGSPNSYTILVVVSSFPYSQNFETNAGGYTSAIVSGSINDWVLGTPAKVQLSGAHSGTKAWVTKTTGTYSDNQNSYVQSPIFNFSSVTGDPTISFWHNFDTINPEQAGWDSGILEVSTDGGTTWTKVDANLGTGGTFNTTNSTNWYNSSSTNGPITPPKWNGNSTGYTGNVSGYIQSTTLLVGMAGQANVRFRWRFGTDSSGQDEGWAIDDISVSTGDTAAPAITYTALGNTTSTANRTLSVTITDATGVDQTTNGKPRIYYRKGTTGSYQVAACTMTTGTATNGTYDCTIDNSAVGGVTGGDVIQYYVAAQDTVATPNVATSPAGGSGATPPGSTAPSSPNSYTIVLTVSSFPYSQDFETNAGGYTSGIASGSINDWILGTPAKTSIAAAHSGTKAWVTKTTGTYSDNQNSYVQSPIFNFSSVTGDPTISFWHNFDESNDPGYDASILEYSDDGGTTWNRVDSNLGTGATFNTTNSTYWYNSSSTNGNLTPPKWSGLSSSYTGNSAGYINSTSVLVGFAGKSDVRFRWRFNSESSFNDEGWAIDDISVTVPTPQTYISSTTTQANTAAVPLGATNQVIIGVQVVTSGAVTPLSATQFNFNTNGSTNPATDIAAARVFYTGTTPAFAATSQFGSDVVTPNGAFTVNGTQPLANGTNYFWLVYDISATATGDDVVDAECTSLVVDSISRTPTVTAPTGSRTIKAPLQGNINVGTGGGNSYSSLTRADGVFNDINTLGASGAITISITSDLTNEDGTVALNQIAGGAGVTIKPSGGLLRNISGSSAAALIKLNGADNVTIDGSLSAGTDRNLTITNTNSGTSSAVIWIGSASASNGANSNTVKNCIVRGNAATTTLIGINVGSGTAIGTVAETQNNGTVIQNNLIAKAVYGIFIGGTSATTLDQNSNISGNTLGTSTAGDGFAISGIFASNQQNAVIANNDIQNVISNSTANISGIRVIEGNGVTVLANKVHASGYNSTSTTKFYGIYSTAATFVTSGNPSNNTFVNNIVYDLTSTCTSGVWCLSGINNEGGYGDKYLFNSVSITGQVSGSTASGVTAAAFSIGNPSIAAVSTSGGFDIRNNIFSMTGTSAAAVTVYSHYTTLTNYTGSTLDYNDLYVAAGGSATGKVGRINATDQTTLANWQTATAQETNSKSVIPLFVSATDLHLQALSTLLTQGVAVGSVTVDFDNDLRDTVPDIGADEVVQGTGGVIPMGTYYNVSTASGGSIGGDVTVTSSLTLNGIVTTGGNTLTVDCNGTVSGANSTNFVVGNVQKNFCAAGAFTYPVGDNTGTAEYSPLSVNVTTLGTPGDGLTVAVFDTDSPSSPGVQRISRYWQLTKVGTGALTTDMTFTYPTTEEATITTPADRRIYRSAASACSLTSVCSFSTNGTDTLASITNVSSFSPWTIAQQAPTAASVNVGGRVRETNGRGVFRARVLMTDSDGNVRMAFTNQFGYFRFSGVPAGGTYIFSATHRRYQFAQPTLVRFIGEDTDGVDFTAGENPGFRPEAKFFDNAPFDFDGDGRTDIAVFRASNNTWYIKRSSDNTLFAQAFGAAGDRLAPADFDGDGRTDLAVFRPAEGRWYIWQSSTNSIHAEDFGAETDRAIPADFDGDGKADLSVWNEMRGTWQVKLSTDGTTISQRFTNGKGNFIALASDRDGDGKADFVFFNRMNGVWTIRTSSGTNVKEQFGQSGDRAVMGDFDGDAQGDLAVYRQSENAWSIRFADGKESNDIRLSANANSPVLGDFDGDGKFDAAGFGGGVWSVRQSVNEAIRQQQFGLADDTIVPAINE